MNFLRAINVRSEKVGPSIRKRNKITRDLETKVSKREDDKVIEVLK